MEDTLYVYIEIKIIDLYKKKKILKLTISEASSTMIPINYNI